jgi:hypothetical protein
MAHYKIVMSKSNKFAQGMNIWIDKLLKIHQQRFLDEHNFI